MVGLNKIDLLCCRCCSVSRLILNAQKILVFCGRILGQLCINFGKSDGCVIDKCCLRHCYRAMSNFAPDKVFLRGVLLHYFNMKKTAAESHRILVEVYGEHALAEQTCQKQFARFKSGDFVLEDEDRPGQPKKFEDEELEALLDEDCCQTQEELAESLGVTQAAVSKRLKAAGYIQKQGNWVLHELEPRDLERRFCMSEVLLERHKQKSCLHRIVTGDEKWIHYDNPKRKKSYVKPGQLAKSTAKPNIHDAKVILCIWWDQKGVLYYELLKTG